MTSADASLEVVAWLCRLFCVAFALACIAAIMNTIFPWLLAGALPLWFAVSCSGCATFTEQAWTPIVDPESVERCVIVYDKVRWNLAKDGPCRGEARI